MSPRAEHPQSARSLRHPAEVPFFVLMVVLNVVIVVLIVNLAWFLPFLPDRYKDTGWAPAIRAAYIGLLLFVPFLIVIRETQRASVRGTAVELSPSQFPELYSGSSESRV